MEKVQKDLMLLADKDYAAFQAKLCPTLSTEVFIGVRVPLLRKYANQFKKNPEYRAFLEELPHSTYDENLLHSILLCSIKPFETCLNTVEAFLPHIDNWAVCDTLRPKIFEKHKDELLPSTIRWIKSPQTYTCRFGVDTLMTSYLDDAFQPEYLAYPAQVDSEEYYVRMMIAWYYATALAKQWDATIPYLCEKRLPVWTHNKTIQKARESRRITPEQKEYLQTLKR